MHDMDSNPTSSAPNITSGRLLSEAQFNDISSRPYDPFWLDRLGLSTSDQIALLNGFPSKLKIDELIRGGALITGDVFRADVSVETAPDKHITTSVTMEAEFFGASPQGQLNIRIRSLNEPSGYRIVKCGGVGKIVQAWMEEDPLIKEGPSDYKSFYICRNGVNLGTLWTMRQKWHLWREEKDAWAALRGQKGRHRRVTKAEKEDGYSYVRGRLTRTTNDGDVMEEEEAAAAAYHPMGDSSMQWPDSNHFSH